MRTLVPVLDLDLTIGQGFSQQQLAKELERYYDRFPGRHVERLRLVHLPRQGAWEGLGAAGQGVSD